MSNTLVDLLGERIGDDLARIDAMTDEQLMASIMPWLDEQTSGSLYAGTPGDRFNNWLQTTVLPHCRKLGAIGQTTWDHICDPDSAINKERAASILLVLSVIAGLQTLDPSTLISIAVMAIRQKRRQK